MSKVTFLLGLCGSGKSHLARQLHAETGARLFEHIASEPDEYARFIQHIGHGGEAIVEEVSYCEPNRRAAIQRALLDFPQLDIEWICFANDLATANWNVQHRTDKVDGGSVAEHLDYNRTLSHSYTIPPGAVVRPIFKLGR